MVGGSVSILLFIIYLFCGGMRGGGGVNTIKPLEDFFFSGLTFGGF